MEPRSSTMRMGIHADTLAAAFEKADQIFLFQANNLDWDIAEHMHSLGERCHVFTDIETMVSLIAEQHQSGDQIVIMSNGAFGNTHKKLIKALS